MPPPHLGRHFSLATAAWSKQLVRRAAFPFRTESEKPTEKVHEEFHAKSSLSVQVTSTPHFPATVAA